MKNGLGFPGIRPLYATVSKETWERALFFEQLAGSLVYVSAVMSAVSLLILVGTKRYFPIDPDLERLSNQKFPRP